MTTSNPTTGLSTAARVVITSLAPTLILSSTNTGQLLTYQIQAEVTDVKGNVQAGTQLYYDIVAGHDVATVSATGLVTAEAPGQVIVQVSAAAFNAHPGAFTPSGIPATGVVYAEQSIQVTEGFIQPDFQFQLDYNSGTGIFTITQAPVPGSTWNGTVQYSLGQKSAFPGSPDPAVIATITGSGTATFTNGSTNFKLQGTDAANNVYHALYTTLSPTFPQYSVRGLHGLGAQGQGTDNSGAARTSAS
jgi:hypothetical protein